MSAAAEGPQRQLSDDEAQLHELGYAQELIRTMGGFSNFAVSFTIISILAGCLTSYFIGFNNGGPIAISWGWLIVGAMVGVVALGMAELASAMPTAGGLYYWSSRLGGAVWGWFTGWVNLVGQVAVTAAIVYGSAIFMGSLLNLWFGWVATPHRLLLIYGLILILHGLLNTFGVRVVALLNDVSVWWHIAGVALIVAVLVVIPDHHQSASFVFTKELNYSGFSGIGFSSPLFWMVFGLGLLMAQYTFTGYDASAHMSEETRNASRGAAMGVIMSVVVSLIFGWIILLAVTFAVPGNIGQVATGGDLGAGFMVQYIWQTATSSKWAEFMLFIAVVAQLFCGMASVTSASRMLFAFSRDGATPFHRTWRQLGSARQPVNAVWCICGLSFLLMVPTWWKPAIGYLVGTSIAIIGLYIAYMIPVYLRWRAGDSFQPGAWSLGRHYKWIDPIAVIWVAFITILFILPVTPGGIPGNENFSWNLVNYAPLTVGGALILFGGWWVLSAKNWFRGPVRMGEEEELEAIEAQLGPAGAD